MLIMKLSGTGVRVDYGMLKMIAVNPPVLQTILVLRGRDTVKLMQIARYSVLQNILVRRGRDTVKLMQIVWYSLVLQTILVLRGRDTVKLIQIVR